MEELHPVYMGRDSEEVKELEKGLARLSRQFEITGNGSIVVRSSFYIDETNAPNRSIVLQPQSGELKEIYEKHPTLKEKDEPDGKIVNAHNLGCTIKMGEIYYVIGYKSREEK